MFENELSLQWFSKETYIPAYKTLPPHSHTGYFHYIFVIDGSALLQVNDETAEAKPNLIMRAPLLTGTHSITFRNDKEYLKTFEFKFLVSDETLFQKISALPFFELCDPNTSGSIPYEMLEIANRRAAFYLDMMQLKFAQMMIGFLSEHEPHPDESKTAALRMPECSLLPTLQYMRANLSHDLTLAELAGHANLSKHYFCSQFKDKFGVSPIQFLTQLRMQKACELLTYADLNVSQVAFEVGYPDVFHFSRSFKRFTGLSPKFYRQKHNPEFFLFFNDGDRERSRMPNDTVTQTD